MKAKTYTVGEVDPKELATIDDLPEIPNGWSTMIRVSTLTGRNRKYARITDDGFIVTVDGEYVRKEKCRLEVVGGNDE